MRGQGSAVAMLPVQPTAKIFLSCYAAIQDMGVSEVKRINE